MVKILSDTVCECVLGTLWLEADVTGSVCPPGL